MWGPLGEVIGVDIDYVAADRLGRGEGQGQVLVPKFANYFFFHGVILCLHEVLDDHVLCAKLIQNSNTKVQKYMNFLRIFRKFKFQLLEKGHRIVNKRRKCTN
jgi:hypothetical protein